MDAATFPAPLHFVLAHPLFHALVREGAAYQVVCRVDGVLIPASEGSLASAVAEAADFLQVHDDEAGARERARAWMAL